MTKYFDCKVRAMRCAVALGALSTFSTHAAIGQTGAQEERGPLTTETEAAAPVLRNEPIDSEPLGATDIQITKTPERILEDILFEGVAVPIGVAEATRPFVGKVITRPMLEELTLAMSQAYRDTDIALFTILVPEQDFRNGVMRIKVAEGFVQGLSTSGEVSDRNAVFVERTFQPLVGQSPLTKTALQRRLLLIRDTPGLSVKPEFRTGNADGAVLTNLVIEQEKPSVSFGFNSRRTDLIDQGQFSANAKIFSLVKPGDHTRLNLAASTDFSQSRYAGLSHSTPIGFSGLRASGSVAIQTSDPDDTEVSGNAELYSLGVSYPVLRSQKQSASVSVAFDALNSENAALGSVFSSERIRALRFGGTYSHILPKRSFSATSRVSRGLDILNTRQGLRPFDVNFLKANLDVAAVQRVGEIALVRINAAGQWTDDTLPTNERFFIGGSRFGRGFRSALIGADRAAAVLLEPAVRPIQTGPFAQSEIYAFADYALGGRRNTVLQGEGMFDLGSVGLGARAAYKRSRLEFEAARRYNEIPIASDQDWIFSVRWRVDIKRF